MFRLKRLLGLHKPTKNKGTFLDEVKPNVQVNQPKTKFDSTSLKTTQSLALLPKRVIQQALFPLMDPISGVRLAKTGRAMKDFYYAVDLKHGPRQKHIEFKLINDIATQLANHIAKGEQAAAKKLLQELKEQDSDLLAKVLAQKVQVTDNSGRIFSSITAFQYALWALDRHMWEVIFPSEETLQDQDAKEENKIRYISPEAAAKQMTELESLGVDYQLPVADEKAIPTIIRGSHHYDFELITAMRNFIHACRAYLPNQRDATVKTRFLQLSLAQSIIPAHVVNEYCRPNRTFTPTPTFKEKELPRVFNITYPSSVWPSLTVHAAREKLGRDMIAIFRSNFGSATLLRAGSEHLRVDFLVSLAAIDLAAMTALYNARKLELTQLKDFLKPWMENDSTLSVSVTNRRG